MTERKKECLKNVINFASTYKKVAIYGAGNVGVALQKDLKDLGINIQCFIVTSRTGQKSEIDGIAVLQLKQLEELNEWGIIIGVSLGKISGIERELRQYGVSNYITLSQEYIDTILEEFNLPKMEITTVIGCSVNCKYCPQKLLTMQYWKDDKQRTREMSLYTFKCCLEKLPLNTQIYFAGMSEAFLNRDCIKMIEYAVDRGYQVGVYTTCVGLSRVECRRLINMPLKSFILHVPDEHNYAHIPITDEYWNVVNMLLDATKKDGTLFIDSGSCQGVPLKEFMNVNNGRIRIESYLHDRAGNLMSKNENMDSCGYIDGEIYCYHSRDRLDHNILLPDGTVLLCCMDYGMKHPIGNLMENTYEEIINGESLNDIRKSLKDDGRDLLCRKCTYAIKCKVDARRLPEGIK